jgi:Carboxypeptidase regulatory-like domain
MLKRVVRIMAAVVLLVSGFSATAQTTAQFSGRVTDPQGAIVRNAEVRVVNQATGVERRVATNNDGLYTVPFLNPGMYQIFVQANGFSTTSSEPITISVGQSLSFDVQLRLMTSQQQVEVAAGVPIIDQTSSSLGTIETTQRIVDLPLNGRNFLQLAYLGGSKPGRAE